MLTPSEGDPWRRDQGNCRRDTAQHTPLKCHRETGSPCLVPAWHLRYGAKRAPSGKHLLLHSRLQSKRGRSVQKLLTVQLGIYVDSLNTPGH